MARLFTLRHVALLAERRPTDNHRRVVRDHGGIHHHRFDRLHRRRCPDAFGAPLARTDAMDWRYGYHRAECGHPADVRSGRHAALQRRSDGRELRETQSAYRRHGQAYVVNLYRSDHRRRTVVMALWYGSLRRDMPFDGDNLHRRFCYAQRQRHRLQSRHPVDHHALHAPLGYQLHATHLPLPRQAPACTP